MLMLHACLSWAFVAPAVLAARQGFVAAAWLLQVSAVSSPKLWRLNDACATLHACLS